MKKENLQRMVDFLKSGKVTQEMFDMNSYRTGDKKTPECNLVRCVLGWCAELDADNIKKNYICSDGEIDLHAWSEHFTGVPWHDSNNFNWDFLFSRGWAYHDNTIQGAIKRLEFFIEIGRAVYDWDFNEETIKFYNA